MSDSTCQWVRVFDQNFNISCVGETKQRASGQFKGKDLGAKWEFIYCPYCGGKIVEVNPISEVE